MAEDTTKNKPSTDEVATIQKDIDIFSGWIKRLENPDPTLRTESGGKGIKLYDEVDRDTHAGGVLQSRYLVIVGKDWEITPGKSGIRDGEPVSTDQDVAIAKFVSVAIDNCARFNQVRRELLQGILYGHYEAEIMWQVRSDGAIVPGKLIGKHPRRFCFNVQRELRLLTLANMIEGEEVPERKFIIFTYGDSDNPYGKGLGQKLWWWVWFKKNGVKIWLIFNEKFGMPTIIGKYPSGTDPIQQKKLSDAIEAIHTDTGVRIPDTMAISLMEATRQGRASYGEFCEYCDKQISKGVLSQTASTEGTPGKLGGDDAQGDVRQEIVEADADLLDEVLNETIIRWIVDYNFPGVISYPLMDTHAAPKPDLTARCEIDSKLVKEIGLPVGRKYFYDTYNIPEPGEGEDVIASSDQAKIYEYHLKAGVIKKDEIRATLNLPPMPGGEEFVKLDSIEPGMPGGPDSPAGFSEAQRGVNKAQELPSMMTDQTNDATDSIMTGTIDQVKKLITDSLQKGLTFSEINKALDELFPSKSPQELGEILARAFITAELNGRTDVMEEA